MGDSTRQLAGRVVSSKPDVTIPNTSSPLAFEGRASRIVRSVIRSRGASPALHLLYMLWVIILLDPQWWIASFGPRAVLQVPTVLFIALLAVTLVSTARDLYPPLLTLMLYAVAMVPFAYISGTAIPPTKQLVLYYILGLGTLSFVRNAAQAAPIVWGVFLVQSIWWVAHGRTSGLAPWHPTNGNYDGFGPQMVLGIPLCFYFGLAVRPPVFRYVAFAAAASCVIGVVASFARGAVLSAALVAAYVWLRSPRKWLTTTGVVLGGLVLIIAAAGITADSPTGRDRGSQKSFWAEMATITQDVNAGTGEDRRALWSAAWRVFLERPVTGVGARNFGAFAADYFSPGDVGGSYSANPARLWDRALHSSYFEILSEFGLIGVAITVWLLRDFWRRNRVLRVGPRRDRWRTATDGKLDVRYLALGLDAAMVAYLATSFFYDQLFVHWFYTLLIVNTLLYRLTKA